MRTILHILASFLLFLLSFRIGLQVHFPMKTLQDKLVWELQNSSNWSVDIQSIDIHSLMSLQANSVSIVQRENKNKEYEEFLFIEELPIISVSPVTPFWNTINISIYILVEWGNRCQCHSNQTTAYFLQDQWK